MPRGPAIPKLDIKSKPKTGTNLVVMKDKKLQSTLLKTKLRFKVGKKTFEAKQVYCLPYEDITDKMLTSANSLTSSSKSGLKNVFAGISEDTILTLIWFDNDN